METKFRSNHGNRVSVHLPTLLGRASCRDLDDFKCIIAIVYDNNLEPLSSYVYLKACPPMHVNYEDAK